MEIQNPANFCPARQQSKLTALSVLTICSRKQLILFVCSRTKLTRSGREGGGYVYYTGGIYVLYMGVCIFTVWGEGELDIIHKGCINTIRGVGCIYYKLNRNSYLKNSIKETLQREIQYNKPDRID